MAMAGWFRALEAVSGVVELARRFRGGPPATSLKGPLAGGVGGALEARLAGVVVAALKEAFDRDRDRLNLERDRFEAESRRAEEALRLELLRQQAARHLWHARATIGVALVVWLASLPLALAVPGFSSNPARILLGLGWVACIAAVALGIRAVQRITGALDLARAGDRHAAGAADPGYAGWLLVAALSLVAAALLVAL